MSDRSADMLRLVSWDLQRFVDAQEHVYATACAELKAGHKRGHWIWFVFPQITGLGRSPTSERYAISSLDEASAYLAHPILGPRLRTCAELIADLEGWTAREVLGHPDDLKLRSSMTLFSLAAADIAIFEKVLERYFGGDRDPLTLERLRQQRERA